MYHLGGRWKSSKRQHCLEHALLNFTAPSSVFLLPETLYRNRRICLRFDQGFPFAERGEQNAVDLPSMPRTFSAVLA
jgi:hypothetical protein